MNDEISINEYKKKKRFLIISSDLDSDYEILDKMKEEFSEYNSRRTITKIFSRQNKDEVLMHFTHPDNKSYKLRITKSSGYELNSSILNISTVSSKYS